MASKCVYARLVSTGKKFDEIHSQTGVTSPIDKIPSPVSIRVSIGLVGLGCAPRRSKLQHQEVAASTEQRSSDRFEAPRRSHASPLLRTLHWLPVQQMIEYQSGSADVQSPQHLDAVVPRSPNPGSRTRPQPAIGHYAAVSTFHNEDCAYRCSAPAVWN